MDGRHGILPAGVHHMGRAKTFGEGQLLIVQIHGNDRVGTGHTSPDNRGEPDAADAKNRHTFIGLNLGGVDHSARASHDSAADNGCHIGFDVGINLHHILLVGDGVIRPGENVLRSGHAVHDI